MLVPGRAPLVLVVLLLGLLLGGCRSEALRDPPAGGGSASGAPAADLPGADVLRQWDRSRARAFAVGNAAALRGLYADGSAGATDVRLLRAYLRRDLRVEGMTMQVLALRVLHEDPERLRLLVTDRLTGAVAVRGGRRVPLPQDQPSTRLLELRRSGPGQPWRMALVRESSRRPAAR